MYVMLPTFFSHENMSWMWPFYRAMRTPFAVVCLPTLSSRHPRDDTGDHKRVINTIHQFQFKAPSWHVVTSRIPLAGFWDQNLNWIWITCILLPCILQICCYRRLVENKSLSAVFIYFHNMVIRTEASISSGLFKQRFEQTSIS